ncbi:hypothetical protein GCM10011591_32840 [Nocardia camponoti]|uniref:Phenyloxazoline synthase MbtB n=1 Tax=Nocardia camponoti TaxID=1616106 RepID=A0A917QM56_9NOCA|nr:amino acid adenylation domain-containing protein [Nocardia camponoti]GGK58086.1 hypothetical protein GCM10011591_32840 [Nocardia camponoti]
METSSSVSAWVGQGVAVRYNPTGMPGAQRELSYAEFDQQSSRIARELIHRGIGPGSVVVIAIARSIESVVATWAVVKSGAAFVPVDPSYSADRIAHIAKDAGADFGLTTAAHRKVLGSAIYWIELDDPVVAERIAARAADPVNDADRVRPLDERDPAYRIYPSGSTGVVVPHAGLAARVEAERADLNITAESRVLHVGSPAHDNAVLELLLTFRAGALLVICPPRIAGGFELSDLVRREAVTHLLITPDALESVDPAGLPDLRAVLIVGDEVRPELVAEWASEGRQVLHRRGGGERVGGGTQVAELSSDAVADLAGGTLPSSAQGGVGGGDAAAVAPSSSFSNAESGTRDGSADGVFAAPSGFPSNVEAGTRGRDAVDGRVSGEESAVASFGASAEAASVRESAIAGEGVPAEDVRGRGEGLGVAAGVASTGAVRGPDEERAAAWAGASAEDISVRDSSLVVAGVVAPTGTAERATASVPQQRDEVSDDSVRFWLDTLADLPEQLDLPTDRPRPAVASGDAETLSFEVPPETHSGLATLARTADATLFTVVHTALAVLLARLSGSRDIAVGGHEGGVANTVVLRSHVDPARPFGDLLADVRDRDLAAFSNADVPLERVIELVGPAPSPARHPLFQVLLTFPDQERDLRANVETQVDLEVGIVERFTEDGQPDGIIVGFAYATDLFDRATVVDIADRWARVFASVLANVTIPVGDIDVLAPGERDLVLREGKSAGAIVPPVTVPDLIATQAQRRPDAVAIRAGDTTLTFAELLGQASAAARALIDAGVGPESLVAVSVPRTEELPVALLAVLLSGAGYLPIDSGYPAQRIEYLLNEARPSVLLTTTTELALIPASDVPVVLLDDLAYSPNPLHPAERNAPLRPDHVAYVTYLSGPAGKPTGVSTSHRNVVELFANTQLLYDFDEDDVWAMSHSFDFAAWELWCALAGGSSVVVVDHLTSRSPVEFRELLAREQVTVLTQTPTAFERLDAADRAAYVAGEPPLPLRYLIFGGEAVDPRKLTGWYGRYSETAPRLVNMLSVTESAGHVTHLELDPGTVDLPVSLIGRAIPGLSVAVLDDRLQPVPFGVAGELYLGGNQLSRGYLGEPGLTATRFVADPFGAPGSRRYRSGDLGRWVGFRGEPVLEYGRRGDAQVQLRGHRIEPAEIEAALLSVAGVGRAAAVVRVDEHAGDRLIGYVVPADTETQLDPAVVRARVTEFLIGYMVPDAVVVLDALPMTASGKLDRSALPAPEIVVANVPEIGAPAAPAPIVARPALAAAAERGVVPLSVVQQQLWSRNGAVDNVPLVLRLRGALDTSALRYAVADVLERHEALRTRFPLGDDGVPFQDVVPVSVALPGGLAVEETEDPHERIHDLLSGGFDVAERVPLRACLYTVPTDDPLAEEDHVLAIVVHQIVADAGSLGPLSRDLAIAYRARVEGRSPSWPPLPVQYADYALWERAVLGDSSDETSLAATQLNFWRDNLAGRGAAPDLTYDRPQRTSLRSAEVSFTLPADVHAGLLAVAEQHDATLFAVVHAALAALLSRSSGNTDIVVGTPFAGRSEPELAELIGSFGSTLALRTTLAPESRFSELVSVAREVGARAVANADTPFDANLQVLLEVNRPDTPTVQLRGLTVDAFDLVARPVKFDVQVSVDASVDEMGEPAPVRAVFTYATALFDEASIRTLGSGFVDILAAVAEDPNAIVAELNLARPSLPDVESADPAVSFTPSTSGVALSQELAAVVEDDAQAPALDLGQTAIEYGDYDARSSRLARSLIARGAGPGTGVAIRLDRGVQSAVATWAILKAGAAVVPLRHLDAPPPAILEVVLGLAYHVVDVPDGLDWYDLADPALVAEVAAESPRPIAYAHRTRALRGDDIAYLGTDYVLTYDQLAAVAERVGLTYESRTRVVAQPDSLIAVAEIVSAGIVGAALVLSAGSDEEDEVSHVLTTSGDGLRGTAATVVGVSEMIGNAPAPHRRIVAVGMDG